MTTASKVGITGLAASYYLTKDLGRSTEFYTNLLGFAPTMAFPDMVSEWTFPSGETFGVYAPPDAENWHPSGGVMFAVPEINSAIAASKATGAKFESENPEDTPVCLMAFGEDPEGNSFILHQAKG